MRIVRRLMIGIVLAALGAGGCATARAKTPPVPAALEVPLPPPRVVVPPEPEPAAPEASVPEPEPRQQKPARRTPARSENRQEPPRTDKKPETPSPVVEPVAPVPPPTATLQQALPTGQTEVERHVRDQISQATSDLSRVDYRALNPDARSQYDTAKRFIKEADQALKEKNLVYAAKVAEKAAGLAAVLVGR
jgi:hypothetical protein